MKLQQLSGNHAVITLANGIQILFSYETPVACFVAGEYFKTSKSFSHTTTRHINSWAHIEAEKPQEYFHNLVDGI